MFFLYLLRCYHVRSQLLSLCYLQVVSSCLDFSHQVTIQVQMCSNNARSITFSSTFISLCLLTLKTWQTPCESRLSRWTSPWLRSWVLRSRPLCWRREWCSRRRQSPWDRRWCRHTSPPGSPSGRCGRCCHWPRRAWQSPGQGRDIEGEALLSCPFLTVNIAIVN